ncbi:MAG TPA: TIGR02449 family protein [Gammaproteobacteria bacterium]|nr:TIGR02449 family protein [Gammaproteobacteria bacterium]
MDSDGAQQASEQELRHLEFRIEELIETVERLQEENRSLRLHQDALVAERARLIEKNETARTRVEAMINRLKSMEHGV